MGASRIASSKIKRLAALHVSDRIPSLSSRAKILRVAKSTVEKYRGFIEKSGYSFSGFAALRPREIDAILDQPAVRHRKPRQRYATLFTIFPQTQANLSEGTENLRQAWAAYKTHHPEGYGYSQFTVHFLSWRRAQGFATAPFAKWQVPHLAQEDMVELNRWRRSNDRTKWAKAVVVIDSHQGVGPANLSSKVEKCLRAVKSWIDAYKQKGMPALRAIRKRRRCSEKLVEMKQKRDRIIEILHETPQIHGINRASWSLKTLAHAFEKQYGQPIGRSTLSQYVIAEGYTFKKARRVLTSPDPSYREKLQEITRVLSHLRDDEKFFSIDEFGPFSVRMRGGAAWTPKGKIRVVPQRQRSKGRLIVTGALELSTNQITHFYSEKKNTGEMIRLLDILLRQYSNQRCLYLSWDAASWHVSAKLNVRVAEVNSTAETDPRRTPFVKLMPLPASAQFLNVIESVFSGMAKAILHNSDYRSVEDCKAAIDRYFAERNEAYRRNPRRAGKKIWGKELVKPCFAPSNNCKDPNWR
jgi:transposase